LFSEGWDYLHSGKILHVAAACENGNRTMQNRRTNSMKEEEGRDQEGLQVQLHFSTLRR
jgi:hypothetical protein